MSVPAAAAVVKVWDRPVRILHWVLVAAVALSALGTVVWVGMHQPAGWVALAVVALRCVWGFAGGAHARFVRFVRGPRATLRYLRQTACGTEPRHLGHNPLGAWMIVSLLLCVAGLALTGWLYTTDAFWGDATIESLHEGLAWTLLVLVALHLAGVAFTSLRQRENLPAAMFSGTKRAARDGDVV